MKLTIVLSLLLVVELLTACSGFNPDRVKRQPIHRQVIKSLEGKETSIAQRTSLYMSLEENDQGYTRKQILKEETEAPFRKVRYFFYLSLTAAAGLASLITGTSIIAVNSGARTGDLPELYQNLAINLIGLPVIGYFWRRDIKSENALLERIDKGGKLAGLKLNIEDDMSGEKLVVKLSDLRRDRGIEKRVIIVAAARDQLAQSIKSTAAMFASLVQSDCLIVPVCISTTAPGSEKDGFTLTSVSIEALFGAEEGVTPPITSYIGMPIQMSAWNSVIKNEFSTALRQNPDALDKGITLIIKKNGKVGGRRFGVPIWESITADIEQRKEAGLDITNV